MYIVHVEGRRLIFIIVVINIPIHVFVYTLPIQCLDQSECNNENTYEPHVPKKYRQPYNCAMLHDISPSQHNPLPNCKYIQTHKNENTYTIQVLHRLYIAF